MYATDKKAVEDVIYREVVWFKYGNGFLLFGNKGADFWQRLAVKIATKASQRMATRPEGVSDSRIGEGVVQTAQSAKAAVIDLDAMNPGEKRSLLESIMRRDNVDELEKLIDQGLDVNQTDHIGRSALQIAAYEGRQDMLKMLLRRGANVNFIFDVDKMGGAKSRLTAIDAAEEKKRIAIVELLREHGGKRGSELD